MTITALIGQGDRTLARVLPAFPPAQGVLGRVGCLGAS